MKLNLAYSLSDKKHYRTRSESTMSTSLTKVHQRGEAQISIALKKYQNMNE